MTSAAMTPSPTLASLTTGLTGEVDTCCTLISVSVVMINPLIWLTAMAPAAQVRLLLLETMASVELVWPMDPRWLVGVPFMSF